MATDRGGRANRGVRPYAIPGGRLRLDQDEVEVEALVTTTSIGADASRLSFERRAIAVLCRDVLSVAEIAAKLRLPLGVVRPLVGLGGWFGAARLARARANRPSRDTVPFELSLDARLLLMACSVGAALVHAEVIRSHFQESTLYGWFFVLSAAAQLIWGLLVLRWPDRALLVSGAIGNGLIVVLWVVTRTTGLPIGPEPWQAESVGAFDVVATVLELALVIGSVALLAGTRGVRRSLPKYDSRETSRMLANLHAPAASTQNSAGRIGGLRHSGDERPATLVSGDRGCRAGRPSESGGVRPTVSWLLDYLLRGNMLDPQE